MSSHWLSPNVPAFPDAGGVSWRTYQNSGTSMVQTGCFSYGPGRALRCKPRRRVSASVRCAGRNCPTYPRRCIWQLLLEELTNRGREQRANLTGEIPKEKVHPAEPQDLALLASVSCKYGNRDLKPCFYIPSLGVLQNPSHNLDIYLVYTAPRQSRAFVPSLPVEPWLVTPRRCRGPGRLSICLPKKPLYGPR